MSPDEIPAGITVVTPTRRLAHHVRAQHDAACAARGLAAWRTPDVTTWNDFVRRQFEQDRAAGRLPLRWLDDTDAQLAWEAVVAADEELGTVLSAAGLGARARRSWTLLHAYAIPLDALAGDDNPEVRAFGRWVDAHERWLQRGAWLDPARAADVISAPERGTVLALAGFAQLTPQQQATLRRFESAGVELRRWHADDVQEAAPALVACNDFAAELETAARWAARRLEQRPGSTVALIVPGLARDREQVRRVLDRVLVPAAALTGGAAPESTAYELAAARPLADRPVVAAALAWLDAVTGEPGLEVASALLRSPFDAAAAAESDARHELDAWLRRHDAHLRGLPRLAWQAAQRPGCSATAAMLERAARRARDWRRARLPSRWLAEFFELLREIGWPGPAPDSAEHQAVERWQSLLTGFAASDDVAGAIDAGTALRQLWQLATTTAFEPQEIAAPLLVIDPETVAGMHFDAAWICRLDATRWPSPAAPDPFLPRDWQARRGVPEATAELAAEASRRLFDELRAVADEVVLSVAEFDDEAPLLPSAFVAGLPRTEPAETWQGSPAAEAFLAQRPRLESLVDGSLPAFAAQQVAKGGARLIELQGACPFRAAVELRLGGAALEGVDTGIDPTERGRLAHAVLEQAWATLRTQARLAAMTADELAAWVRTLTHERLEELRAGADPIRLRLLDLEQRWLEARVLELLQQDLQRPPFEVIHVEEPFAIDVGGVQVSLRLDRVDRLADGSLAVIDYKTGGQTKPAAWLGERPELPQLPLYVRAMGQERVAAVAFGVVRKAGTGYAGYARDAAQFPQLTPFIAGRKPFEEYASWDGMMDAWQQRLEALALEHARGVAGLAHDPGKACRYCHLVGMCRATQPAPEEEALDAVQ